MRRRISNALSVVSVVVLLVCAVYLLSGVASHKRSNRVADELRNIYQSTVSAEKLDRPVATPTVEVPQATVQPMAAVALRSEANALPTEKPLIPVEGDLPQQTFVVEAPTEVPEPVLQDRFVELYEKNDDLIGWIHVNDSIDYPMVWLDDDNDYYMNHDFYGNESNSGWIFLDKRNASDMSDDHLLIYGHNMRLGDMFGDLDLYRELDYVQENPIIEIQSAWEAEPRKYVIISLFDASMNKSHSTYIKITNFNFETPEEKTAYIDTMYQRSIFDLPCETNADDQLVTLVTCSYSYPNGRFLIVARELREDETEEQITQMFAELN